MTQNLSLSRVTLYKNNLAFAERQGSLNQTEIGRTGMFEEMPPSHWKCKKNVKNLKVSGSA